MEIVEKTTDFTDRTDRRALAGRIDSAGRNAFLTSMVGALGLNERHLDDLIPLERMVESHPMLDVFQLARECLLTPGTEVKLGDGGNLRALSTPGILELDGQPVSTAPHKALPMRVFVCPACGRDCYRLHEVGGRWTCRKCSKLDYLCRHRGRTIPGLHRVRHLRRKIGADLMPFGPLPAKPLRARKHWRLAREIRQLEERLLAHARRDVCEVLERRHHGRS